jgi:hypothetical protein
MGEGIENLVYLSRGTLRVLLHAVKSYDMGPSRFTSRPKEGVLRIFMALKYPSPWSGSNPQPFGPVASILTTTPLTRLYNVHQNGQTGSPWATSDLRSVAMGPKKLFILLLVTNDH